MKSVLILYESKYGFTENIAKKLALVLGPARYCKASKFIREDYENFSDVVICSPAYMEKVPIAITKCVEQNLQWLRERKVFLVSTCLSEDAHSKYLKPLSEVLGESVVFETWVGGELILNKLDQKDSESIKQFSKMSGFILKDYNNFDGDRFYYDAMKIKEIKDIPSKIIEKEKLKNYIDEFLISHNTCTLATSYGDNIRATPIEYVYMEDKIYFISEGGEKFLNILFNKKVAIAVYDSFKSMNSLAGMQLAGTADIIEIGSDEYKAVLEHRGFKYDNIIKLPAALNMIKVDITKIEFLWSEFTKMGADAKQILSFKKQCK